MEKLLLVDFENVQQVDLSQLDDTFHIIVFVGANQKSVPIELVKNLQGLGNRVAWQKVDGNGSNALDFFIACELGRVRERSPQSRCIVLSKDKGFDPLRWSITFREQKINAATGKHPRDGVSSQTGPVYFFSLTTRNPAFLRQMNRLTSPSLEIFLSASV
jgi:hypothetical protein